MTQPLTDQQLAAMRTRLDRGGVLRWADATALLAEVEQLRKERDHLDELYQSAEKHVGELLGLANPAVGLTAPACPCGGGTVHQQGCEGGE